MSQQRPSVLWMWENDAGTAFNNFDTSDCDLLENAHRTNAQVLKHSTKPWIFDLAAMTQTNTISSAKRNVKRMDPSSAPVGHRVADAAAAQAQQLPAFGDEPSPVQISTHNSGAPLPTSDSRVHCYNASPNLTHLGVTDAPQQLTESDVIVDASLPAAAAITITDDCKVLGRILQELGALHLLQEFIDLDQKDSKLAALYQSSPKILARLYSMSEATAVQFMKMCRHASMPVHAGHERWLKACLILRACAIGVRLFVGAVMKQLHDRVVNEVRETICEYKSECDDSDWKCDTLQENDLAFDERPSVLQVVSLQYDGTATTDLPHRLSGKHAEPFFLSKRNTKGIFSKEGVDGFGLSNLFMRSLPVDASASKVESERRFVMQNVCKWNTPYLKPFEIHREDGRDSYTVVYCQCKIDEAPRLIVTAGGQAASSAEHAAHLVHEQHSKEKNEGDLHWRFWTIQKKSDKDTYKPHEHNLISGDVVSFSGSDLPEGIVSGNKYTVLISSTSKTKLGKKSFDVCATLVPSNPFDHSRDLLAGAEPRMRILRPAFPVGLYRDAAHRYHTKGTNSELSKRWDGVNVRQISTDFFEFAKLFCSKTTKDLKNYFAPDQESSPELLYNMIIYCKAFHSSKTQPFHGFCSFFCDGDKVLTNCLAPILDGIQVEAAILTACRNTICHGDFYSLEEVVFERLKESSAKILQCIEDAALIMNHTEHAQAFQRVREVASFQREEIFLEDPTLYPPRICILNRLIELTSEEQQHLNEIIQGYQLEIRELQDQCLSMRRRPFSKLPVYLLEDIRKQIADQSGKAGAQGNVYNVELWGEQLAAKLFHSGKDAHWKRELNSLTVLLHGNIVQVKYVIYDGLDGKDKQEPVGYVMERMHCSLYDYSKESHSMQQLFALLMQVALAVAYTHANNVAHMDIKPENILLDESKSVAKLCDFGCAHFLQTTLHTTLTSRGTKFFMAPEIIPDDVGSCKPFPVDVYAFGVTMWHLMNPGANCQQLTECDWSRSPQVPPAVSQLGRRCTNRNPDERPTMQEVYDMLKNIVASPYALDRFLESAGIVPAEHYHEFARKLSAQGLHDQDCLRRKLKQTPEFLNIIGMNSDQQMRLSSYLSQHFDFKAAPVDVDTLSSTVPAAFLPPAPSGSHNTIPVSSPLAVPAATAHSLTDISVPDMALIVASHGTDYERYSAAIMSNSFDGSVIDMLDMNDVMQLMQSMGISISHGLRLKATFASWKKNPDAAFEALALAKVAAAKRAQAKALAAKMQVTKAAAAAAPLPSSFGCYAAPGKYVRHNGYIYAVAHVHDVDTRDIIPDGDTPVDIDAGFEIAPGDASDIQVANAHTWGSRLIVFYDGSIAATALNIAVNRFRIGWRHGRDNLLRDGAKVWAKDKDNDIFLRKRA